MLASLPLSNSCNARVVRILDTLSVAEMEISESLWSENKSNENLNAIDELRTIEFDADGNLLDDGLTGKEIDRIFKVGHSRHLFSLFSYFSNSR